MRLITAPTATTALLRTILNPTRRTTISTLQSQTPFSTTSIPSSKQPTEQSTTSTPTRLHTKWFDPSHTTSKRTTKNNSSNNNTDSSTTPTNPLQSDHATPEERQLNLGNTLRTLQRHLPGLLTTPLPAPILSPSITLVLFPSTHPHLPVVRGRMAYIAALWTAPVAWGHLPGVGVRLKILSERMIGEEFVVRWQTTSSDTSSQNMEADVDKRLNEMDLPSKSTEGGKAADEKSKLDVFKILRERKAEVEEEVDNGEGFAGIFVFTFDEKGRIARHIIEHTDRGRDPEGSTIISVTEWLLRKAKEGASKAAGNGGLVLGCNGKDKS